MDRPRAMPGDDDCRSWGPAQQGDLLLEGGHLPGHPGEPPLGMRYRGLASDPARWTRVRSIGGVCWDADCLGHVGLFIDYLFYSILNLFLFYFKFIYIQSDY